MKTDEVMQQIDRLTAPNRMSKQQALEFLETVVSDCEARAECLKEEIKNEAEE